jgi:hypothetical protein
MKHRAVPPPAPPQNLKPSHRVGWLALTATRRPRAVFTTETRGVIQMSPPAVEEESSTRWLRRRLMWCRALRHGASAQPRVGSGPGHYIEAAVQLFGPRHGALTKRNADPGTPPLASRRLHHTPPLVVSTDPYHKRSVERSTRLAPVRETRPTQSLRPPASQRYRINPGQRGPVGVSWGDTQTSHEYARLAPHLQLHGE